MGPPSYMPNVVDRNVVMRRIAVICSRPTALTTFHNNSSTRCLMKGYKIPRIELNTVHLYQHYSLFMYNKLQYT